MRVKVRSDRHVADPDRRAVRVVLSTDELVRIGDAQDVADTGQRRQVELPELVDVADKADDRSGEAAADECLTPGGDDAGDDRVDLLGGGAGIHDDDHVDSLCSQTPQASARNAKPRTCPARGSRLAVAVSDLRDAGPAARPRLLGPVGVEKPASAWHVPEVAGPSAVPTAQSSIRNAAVTCRGWVGQSADPAL